MADNSPQDSIAILLISELMSLEQMVRSRISKVLPKGMEISHFSVLNQLNRPGEEKSPVQLARIFNVTKGAMTNTVGKLETAGYVHVRPDWHDSRRKQVSISAAGGLALQDANEALKPIFDQIIAALGVDRARQLLPILRELRQVLDQS